MCGSVVLFAVLAGSGTRHGYGESLDGQVQWLVATLEFGECLGQTVRHVLLDVVARLVEDDELELAYGTEGVTMALAGGQAARSRAYLAFGRS